MHTAAADLQIGHPQIGLGRGAHLVRHHQLRMAAAVHPVRLYHFVERRCAHVCIATVLVGFDVLAQRRRIRVALIAANHLAQIGLFRGVRTRVLEAIRRIRVGLGAAFDRTRVRFLARMRSRVDLEVFGARKGLVALVAAVRLLFGVRAHMDEHLVAGVEAAFGARASVPLAVVEAGGRCNGVRVRDMRGQLH